MIKIELSNEKRKKIEELFLTDLVEGTTKDRQQGKQGKLIETLKSPSCINLLDKDKDPALRQYLYDKAKVPHIKNIKTLLLANRTQMENFIKCFQNTSICAKDLLDNVFPYKNFSYRKVVNEIVQEMEIPVCPYCNRLYITVLKKKNVRPQLDHFFPKSRYPYLALCLYNLVPSCSVCNQAKSALDPMRDHPLLYPYEEEFGEKIVFKLELRDKTDFVQKMQGNSSKIRVKIQNPAPQSNFGKKVKQQERTLHLTDLYSEHGDYVADILKSYHINTQARIEELLQCFPDIFSTPEEIRRLMFMNYIDRDQWGKRPLSKLTHDICLELDSLMF